MRVVSKGQLCVEALPSAGSTVELQPIIRFLPVSMMVNEMARRSPTQHAIDRNAFKQDMISRLTCCGKENIIYIQHTNTGTLKRSA